MIKENEKTLLRILNPIFLMILLLKILESFVLKGHGDGVSYHLVMPRYILEYGFLYPHKNFFLTAQTGIFDYIYTIPQALFTSGLSAHLISQFIHFFFSIILAILFFNDLFKKHRIVFTLMAISFLTFNRSPDFFIYAKNDGFLAFVFLFATVLTFNELPDNRLVYRWVTKHRHLFIGFFLGFLPVIKMNGLIYSFVLFCTYVFLERKNLRSLVKPLILAALTSSIIFLRNWLIVKNPTFPAFIELFPTLATPEMIAFHNAWLKNSAGLIGVLKNYIIAFTPKNIFYLFIPLAWWNHKNNFKKRNIIPFFVFCFTSLYCLRNPGYAAERFYFGCHFVMIYFVAKSLEAFLNNNQRINLKHMVLMILVIFADSKIDKTVKRVFNFYGDIYRLGYTTDLLHKYAPYTKIWQYVEANSNVASDYAPMQYYAPPKVRLFQAGNSIEANFFLSCEKISEDKLNFFQYFLLKLPLEQCLPLELKLEDALVIENGYALFKLKGIN